MGKGVEKLHDPLSIFSYHIVTGISVCSLTAVYVARLRSQTRRRLSLLDGEVGEVRTPSPSFTAGNYKLHLTPAVSHNQLYSSLSDYS